MVADHQGRESQGRMTAMKWLLTAVAIAATCLTGAGAQTYPSRPITIVVPFTAGGPTDTIARIFGARLGASLGQTVVIENTTGASGTLGVGRVARAAPNGYTVGIGHWGTHVVNGALYPPTIDLLNDFEPVALIASNPQLLIAKKSVPAKDLKELVEWVKANQDKISAGTGGVGAASHISGVYFQNVTGTKFVFVPYRGTGPALQDVVAGTLDLIFDQTASALPQVRNGNVRAFAVTAKTRLSSAPDIPTVDEAGMPGFYIAIWHALWLPKKTPRDIVTRLNGAVREALLDPTVRQRLVDLGQDIPAADQQTPEALYAYHKAEIEKWHPIVKAAGIKPE
jgi:tripartite-type tricarboxylate transporter receptor subunit TctC